MGLGTIGPGTAHIILESCKKIVENPIWRVPKSRSHDINRRLRNQIEAALAPILYEDWWDSQRIVVDFEKKFGDETGYAFTSAVQSGAAGLRLALLACGVKAGDEVITVANSDMATTASISQCGAMPVFCDVRTSDYNINPDLVESLITERTKVILPVDLYGHPVDVKSLKQIADRHGIYIIEDACIAMGAEDYGKPIGYFATMTVFSTAAGKPVLSAGGGGIVVTSREELWEKVETLKGYGRRPEENLTVPEKYDHVVEGYNLRMVPVDAALLRLKMPYFKEWSDQRRQVSAWYAAGLRDLPEISIPVFRPESKPIFRTYTVCAKNRDGLYRHLRGRVVQASLNYVPAVHLQTVYKNRHVPGSDDLPVTEYLSEQLLCLPVDPMHTRDEITYVCEQINEYYSS